MTSQKNYKKTLIIFLITAIFLLVGLSAFVYFYKKMPTLVKTKAAATGKLPAARTEALGVLGKAALPIAINIHEGRGHIVESYKSQEAPDKVIIHIQDIHTNYEAQKNMSQIIEALIKDKGLKLITVEGGWGDVSLTYLRNYADKERRLEVAEEYLKEGKISGEEYLNIISDYDMDIEGVEEESLYKKNLDTFFKIEAFRGEGTKRIERLKEITGALKEKIYPLNLFELEKKRSEYNQEKISLAEFYEYLLRLASENRLGMSSFENFNRFINIAKLEERIDFPRVEKERAGLIERLSKLLDKDKLAPLVTKSLEFRLNKITPAEYHSYLKKTATEAGINFESYPDLSKYLEYIKSHEDIDTNILFKEADLLEKTIKEALIKTEDQKKLNNLSRALEILDNFLNLKLIPDDFAYYKEHKNDFLISGWLSFLKEKTKAHNIKQPLPEDVSILDNNLSTLVEFYDIAVQRDEIFIQKLLSLMDEKSQKIAVLITGGFHTPNLTKMLKEKNLSYIVVAPKTTQKTDPELYRYILQYKSGRTE